MTLKCQNTVFLNEGVNRYMSYQGIIDKTDDNYNENRLKSFHLPVIKSVNQLLDVLCFTHGDEMKFFYSENRKTFLYHKYYIDKRNSNEQREIEVPHPKIKEVQKLINKHIFSKFNMSDSCHGFHKNRSTLTNALPHVGAKTLLKFDIKDFFPSIKLNMVVKQFRFFGYGVNVSKYLGYLCVNNKFSLPQGAPTSPYLSNLICIKIDKRIEAFCSSKGLSYTRYADDITISSKEMISYNKFKFIESVIQNIINDPEELYSFKLNEKKSHRIINGQKMVVTGVLVNTKANAQKSIYRELDNAIKYISIYGIEDHMDKMHSYTASVYNYKQHLFGLACYVNMFNREKGSYYLNQLKQLDFGIYEVDDEY